MGWRCDTCGRSFGSTRALRQHMSALGHVESPFQFKCHRCPTMFRTSSDADDHMCLYNHWSQQCSRCPASTPTEDQLKQHEIECHFWCSKCEREFQSYNNIKMHMNSRVHLGTSITCPCCTSSFTTATGLAHHLETGSCPKATGLNRDVVYNLIRSVDHNGLIAKNLIGWHGSTTYEASERANVFFSSNIRPAETIPLSQPRRLWQGVHDTCRGVQPPRERDLRRHKLPNSSAPLPRDVER